VVLDRDLEVELRKDRQLETEQCTDLPEHRAGRNQEPGRRDGEDFSADTDLHR
jgi:hypothetical protein